MQRIRLLTVTLTVALLAGCTGARPTTAPDASAAAASPSAGSGQAPAPAEASSQKSRHAQALEKLAAGDRKAALELLKQAVRETPGQPAVHNDLAYVYLLLDDPDMAALEARNAIGQAEGKDPVVYAHAAYNLGEALMRLKQFAEAARWLEESARLQPDRAEPRALLTQAYQALDRTSGDPRKGALWTGSLDGRKLYLYAADQKSWVEENPWCGAVKGETGHGGTYAWYVEPAPGAEPVRQALHLFSQWNSENGGGNLRFGGGMPLPATWELRGRTLVVVMQTANCNFKEYQFFGWDDQTGAMRQYAFQFAQGKQPTQWLLTGTAGVQGSHLVTRSYNNAQGGWTTRTWDLQGDTFVEIKTEAGR